MITRYAAVYCGTLEEVVYRERGGEGRTRRDAGSRPGSVFERNLPGYIWKSLPRPDWSARVGTRDIDWLGTTWSLARTHKYSFQKALL